MRYNIDKALQHLRQDAVLEKVIDTVQLDHSDECVDVYIYLIKSIISQQLSTQVAATIYHRVIDHEDIDPFDPHSIMSIDDNVLRSLGLSFRKASYIKNVSRYFIENTKSLEMWMTMSDEEIINELTSIKGVGVWTVQMVLMFALCRLDVFPLGDLGIQQGMKAMYNIDKTGKELKTEMLAISEKWKPYRSMASRYVWRYKDDSK